MKQEGKNVVEILKDLIELRVGNMSAKPEQSTKDKGAEAQSKNASTRDSKQHKSIRRLIRHPQFRDYALSTKDVWVITDLWLFHLEFPQRGSSFQSICAHAKLDNYDVSACGDFILSLLERNILNFYDRMSGDYYLNPLLLQSAEYTLSKSLLLKIMGRDLPLELQRNLKSEWCNDQDFLEDLRLIFDLCYNSFGELGCRNSPPEYPILSATLSLLCARIDAAPPHLGIKAITIKYSLQECHLALLLLTWYHQLYGDDCLDERDIVHALAPNPRQRWKVQKELDQDSLLLSEAILVKEPQYRRGPICGVTVSDEILQLLGCGAKGQSKAEAKKHGIFFQKCATGPGLANLIIPEEDKSLLKTIINKCLRERQEELNTWGFMKTKAGSVILLYGAPGTGKTMCASALAHELGKELLQLNVPQLRNKYYGETEKQVKKAFTEMRELALEQPSPPIFLLNEADQLVHARVQCDSTCGTIENSIQSIILEELETFPGILILTTNLEANMDEAFFRRFDLKLKFRLPDPDCRRKLWQLYLKPDIPGAIQIDTAQLAQQYRFSGAQIALLVQNACLEAINREGDDKRLKLEDIIKYAALEQPWTANNSKSIGF